MQYYVIGPDGAKYGPGDVPTLKQWAADNRLSPQTILEDINTGQRMAAYQVPGIFDVPVQAATAQPGTMGPAPGPEQHLYQNPPNMAPGYYPRQQQAGDGGQTLIIVSWICSAVGLLCCPIILCLAGIICAIIAGTQGSKKWIPPLIFGICMMVTGIVIGVLSQNWLQELLRQLQQPPR
jgi:hypothetical protein